MIVDSLEQCSKFGDLSFLDEIPECTVELGKMVAAEKEGSAQYAAKEGQLVVCDLTGVAAQDVKMAEFAVARVFGKDSNDGK